MTDRVGITAHTYNQSQILRKAYVPHCPAHSSIYATIPLRIQAREEISIINDANRNDRPEVYISVDVETSGPIPGEYSMLSIGACVVGHPEQCFYIELQPVSDNAVAEAMEICGLSLEQLKAQGIEPRAAMTRFDAWLSSAVPAGSRPIFVGFNAPFDWSFVHYYFVHYLGRDPFGHSALDIKSYYMGARGLTWAETSQRRMGSEFLPPELPHTHNALDDAQEQAEIFARLLRAETR